MGKEKILFLGKIGKKYIKLYGDGEKICCSEIDNAILSSIEKIVEYYAKRFFDFQHPTCELEKTDDGVIGFYVFDEDDEDVKSKYYYVKVAKLSKNAIIYKIDFTKEDFKLMP
ncbi:MAG: hypothetical protein QXM27_02780 [Candidatus Pacearchaeota archaeon]